MSYNLSTIINYKEVSLTPEQTAWAESFHKNRIAFAILKDGSCAVNLFDQREHRIYLQEDFGIDDAEFETLTRGFIKRGIIAFYKSSQYLPLAHIPKHLYMRIAPCVKLFGSGTYEIWNGFHIGEPGQLWEPIEVIGQKTYKFEGDEVVKILDEKIKLDGKLVVVINGKGSIGKDTLCNITDLFFRTKNISTIDPIKDIGRKNGWNGSKDEKSRRFLSDLKEAFSRFDNTPFKYIKEKHLEFMSSINEDIMFIHAREPENIEEIKTYINEYSKRHPANQPGSKHTRTAICITMLARKSGEDKKFGNMADDNVDNYEYDYYFDINAPIAETVFKFSKFLADIILDQGIKPMRRFSNDYDNLMIWNNVFGNVDILKK